MFSPSKLNLKPSIGLSVVFLLPSILLLLLISTRDLPIYLSLALSIITATCSLFYTLRFSLLKTKHAITAINTFPQSVTLLEHSGKELKVSLQNNYFISPFFSILSFTLVDSPSLNKWQDKLPSSVKRLIVNNKASRHVLIYRYNIDNPAAYRKLRVFVRYANLNEEL